MKRSITLSLFAATLVATTASAGDSLAEAIQNGKVKGNVKYYYINTHKEKAGDVSSTAFANSIGGQLSYTTGAWNSLTGTVTFMTTQPFALPDNVDTSIIGRDNAIMAGAAAGDPIGQDGFSVLGEAYLSYSRDNFSFWGGRKVIKTPLINAKEVRMLPSAVKGAHASLKLDNGFKVGIAYLDAFKQRTSSEFVNIVKHALGADTKAITGSESGVVVPVCVSWKGGKHAVRVVDYYAPDFINSIYADWNYRHKQSDELAYAFGLQAIVQDSVGNADDNLAQAGSVTGGKAIKSRAVAAKLNVKYSGSSFTAAYSNVFSDDASHDSLVLPWDGTPLYTNMITANNLFLSNYGKGLGADTAYIGGTSGVKIAYGQDFGRFGYKGFGLTLSSAWFDNDKFDKTQNDLNAVISYKKDAFSIALKGIWVRNGASAAADGTVSQLPILHQYRVIANYKF
ncbi:OprD family outer membrane porin [Hydrogenimonas sp.]